MDVALFWLMRGCLVVQFMENNRHQFPQADARAALAALREQGAWAHHRSSAACGETWHM